MDHRVKPGGDEKRIPGASSRSDLVPFTGQRRVLVSRHPEALGAKRRASKGDGRGAGADILRGSLRSHLRMTDRDQRAAPLIPDFAGAQSRLLAIWRNMTSATITASRSATMIVSVRHLP